MAEIGDEVILISPFWHLGEDIGDYLGRIISTESYILVDIYDYHSNPVKCFQNDFEVLKRRDLSEEIFDFSKLVEF